jgi:ABC-2 type transport system permease protein
MNINRIKALIYKHTKIIGRDMGRLIDAFWWPLIDIAIWGFVSVTLMKQSSSNVNLAVFFIGAVILWNFVSRTQLEISVTALQEMWDRNIVSLFASPLTTTEFLSASIVLGLLKLSITIVTMTIAAALLYAFNIFSLGFYLIPFAINLIIVGWWASLFVTGLIFRYGFQVETLAWSLVYILMPISAVYYPVAVLPPLFQTIAWLSPATYVFEGMRSVLATGTMNWHYLVIGGVLNIVYLVMGLVFYAKMLRKFREYGLIKHFL